LLNNDFIKIKELNPGFSAGVFYFIGLNFNYFLDYIYRWFKYYRVHQFKKTQYWII